MADLSSLTDEQLSVYRDLLLQKQSATTAPKQGWASATRSFQGNSTPTHGAPVRMENTPPSLRKMTPEEKSNAAMEFLSMTGLGGIGQGVNRIAHSGDPQAPPQTPYQNYLGEPPADPSRRSQFDEIVGGLSDMARGGIKLASPVIAGATAGPLLAQGSAAVSTGPWGVARMGAGLLGGAVGAGVGAIGAGMVAEGLGAGPGVAQASEDVGGLAGGILGGIAGSKAISKVQNWVVGDPVKNTVQALRPSNSKIDFENKIQVGNPIIKAQEGVLGRRISSVEDYIDAAELAKKQLGANIEQALGPGRLAGATIDGNKIVSAALDAIPQTVRQENPAFVARLNKSLSAYRRPITLDEADGLRIEWNAKLTSDLYSKFPNAQNAANIADPDIATRNAMVTTLRRLADEKVEQLLPGSEYAAIRKDYGAVSDLQDSAFRRLMVANRQADLSLHERFAWAKALARSGVKLATGNPGGALGDALEAGASTAIKEAGTSNSKIANAMKVTAPATPRNVPPMPRPAGLLEAGPIRMPEGDTSGPTGTTPSMILDAILQGRMTPNGQAVSPVSRQIAAGSTPVGVSGTLVPDVRGNIMSAVNREMAGPRLLPPPSQRMGKLTNPFNADIGSRYGDLLRDPNARIPAYQLMNLIRNFKK